MMKKIRGEGCMETIWVIAGLYRGILLQGNIIVGESCLWGNTIVGDTTLPQTNMETHIAPF